MTSPGWPGAENGTLAGWPGWDSPTYSSKGHLSADVMIVRTKDCNVTNESLHLHMKGTNLLYKT